MHLPLTEKKTQIKPIKAQFKNQLYYFEYFSETKIVKGTIGKGRLGLSYLVFNDVHLNSCYVKKKKLLTRAA